MNKQERKLLLGMLDDLVEYLSSNGNDSLLARIYGVFTIKTDAFDPMDIMIMQNTTNLINRKNPKMIFDLKGSTIGRKSKLPTSEKFWLTTRNQKKVMKDVNFLEINKDMDEKLTRLLP